MARKSPSQPAPFALEPAVEDNSPTPSGSATRVAVTGRLVADPELRYTASGIAVSRLRLAVRGTEGVLFQDVVAWNRLAEVTAEYLVKGRRVRVEGRLRGRSWAGLFDVEVIASAIDFL